MSSDLESLESIGKIISRLRRIGYNHLNGSWKKNQFARARLLRGGTYKWRRPLCGIRG